jgi:long-chain acyl-CoA synthetase
MTKRQRRRNVRESISASGRTIISEPRSLAELFLNRLAATPDREAFRSRRGDAWTSWTWREAGAQVRALACGLRALGLEDEQRCAILSSTRIEWILVDLAILCAGGATTTIYPSSTAEECEFIVSDSDSVLVFAEDGKQAAKLKEKRASLPRVRRVVLLDGPGDGDWLVGFDELLALGRRRDGEDPTRFEATARAVGRERLATLVYTSGTTGRPKGVELTHDAWLYEGEAIDALGLLTPDDVHFLWLPLSHVFGKVLEIAQLRIGFLTAVDGRVDRLVDNLAQVRPTFVAAVPRIFEKVHNKVITGALDKGGLTLAIFRWAMDVGAEHSKVVREARRPSPWLALRHRIADRLVFRKLRERFGGRLRFFVSGSAPLSRELTEFFHAAGILLIEGYGLTETSAATFVNRPDRFRLGTVGLALPGTECRIAEDGEILVRGRGVMRGYSKLPDATREVLDDQGWLHTGDIGERDGDGFLRITDRKKDLIKTSGGKYVAPQAIEGKLKAISPWVSQVLVHGNNRNYCSALITLDEEAVKKWAREHGLAALTLAELSARDEVRALVQAGVDELNRGLASYEGIKKFALLPHDFTQESGEITASLKVKRKVVEQKYRPILDSFYADSTVSL